MTRKSQQDLEQPAKVYQLDAVEVKVDQALAKLDQIANSVNGVTTRIEVETMIEVSKKEIKEDVTEQIAKIHLEYGPTKKGVWWVISSIGAVLIAQLVLQFMNRSS